ncbi:hypothetical protein Btru_027278 [Bulinus truncatus]|nr:hypothetical protein Btru_027278 [Bulinus truncatus]
MTLQFICGRRELSQRIVYVFLLSTTALLITLHISSSKLEKINSGKMYKCHVQNPLTNFSFPEINETRVLSNEGKNVGQVHTLYFLSNDLRGGAEKDVDLLSFQRGLSFEDRQALLMLFQKFVSACLKYNVTFFLYGGTLLGSLRHHDIIPWDDDIDVMANSSDRALLRQALSYMHEDFRLDSPEGKRWKFYWTKPKTLLHKPFRWPYIDIFFFLENSTHIFDEIMEYRETFSYDKHQIFPLCFRPFAGSLLPAPRQSTSVVNRNYSPSLCSSLSFSHKMEAYTPQNQRITIPCARLHGLYPFVQGEVKGGYSHEQLLLNNRVLGTFTEPANFCCYLEDNWSAIEVAFLGYLHFRFCKLSSRINGQRYLYSSDLLVNLTFKGVNLSRFHGGGVEMRFRKGGTDPIYLLRLVDFRLDADRQFIAYPMGLTSEEREAILALLQTFAQVCSVFKIPFFLYGGSLVGSLRHHDIIPWDDDIDVMVSTKLRASLRHAVNYTLEDIQLDSPDNERWKLYWTKGKQIKGKQYMWPYVDIFFYAENETHVYDELEVYRAKFSYPKEHVFPLCLRPFAGEMLPVPNNYLAFAERNYNLAMCESMRVSHKLETDLEQLYSVPCAQLGHLYPFVHRRVRDGYLYEEKLVCGAG